MFDYRSSKRAAADQAHTALPPRIQYEILRFDYTVSSRKLQHIKNGGILRMDEISKMQKLIIDLVHKIRSKPKLERILRLVQHLYIG